MTLRLTLDVTYDTNGETESTLRGQLRKLIDHAAQHGLMSGETEAIVTDWTVNVERRDDEGTERCST